MTTSSDADGYTSSDAGLITSEGSAPTQALNHAKRRRFQDRERWQVHGWLRGAPAQQRRLKDRE